MLALIALVIVAGGSYSGYCFYRGCRSNKGGRYAPTENKTYA